MDAAEIVANSQRDIEAEASASARRASDLDAGADVDVEAGNREAAEARQIAERAQAELNAIRAGDHNLLTQLAEISAFAVETNGRTRASPPIGQRKCFPRGWPQVHRRACRQRSWSACCSKAHGQASAHQSQRPSLPRTWTVSGSGGSAPAMTREGTANGCRPPTLAEKALLNKQKTGPTQRVS